MIMLAVLMGIEMGPLAAVAVAELAPIRLEVDVAAEVAAEAETAAAAALEDEEL